MAKKVLIVDDSLLLHKMYEISLATYSAHAVEMHFAESGQEGLAKLSAHPDTDLILLDVNMPEMNGLEFLEHVRREPAFETIAVVMVSTEDHQSDVERGLAAGADAYICKPFSQEQLHERLDNVFADANNGVSGQSG